MRVQNVSCTKNHHVNETLCEVDDRGATLAIANAPRFIRALETIGLEGDPGMGSVRWLTQELICGQTRKLGYQCMFHGQSD